MQKTSQKIINGITLYRIIMAPVLLVLIFTGNKELFSWLLPVSYFTDSIDGILARKYKVTSILGAKLDSIGDDLTVLVSIVGVFIFQLEFIKEQILIVAILLALLAIQNIFALVRYRKITSFHTYLAKLAALLQGIFFILFFFFPEPIYPLFYAASVITMIELVEEIILVIILPKWETNVKGLYWTLKNKSQKS